jgi:xylitol oxidase
MGAAVTRANWAGNVTFGARNLHRPASVAQLQRLVAGSDRVRALGTAHSFSRIADSTGDQVSVAGLPPVIELDAQRAAVRVAGGVRYGELAIALHAAGYALGNLGSLPHISVAGACATGTHGSGVGNGNLATAVSAIELVTAGGDLATLHRGDGDGDGDGDFAGAVVGLGALGIVTALTLDVLPTFHMRQYVYDDLPFGQLVEHADEILAAGYSVSLFTDWAGPRFNQVWRKLLAGDPAPPARWLGATLADGPRHPVAGMPVANCTEQLGVPGPWHERLPHFRLEFTPSAGDELQSEYLLPREQAIGALTAVAGVGDRVSPVLLISEIRTVAADDLWLSPSYRRDSVAIHFTWIADPDAVAPAVAAVEAALAPFAARPHWGKVFGVAPDDLRPRYERLADFQRLRQRYDPAGKFGNELVDRYVPATPVESAAGGPGLTGVGTADQG